MLRDATLKRLSIYSLRHQVLIDEPQAEIFDTLNGTQKALEPFDHVRNSLFIRISDDELAKETYASVWEPLERKIKGSATKRIKSQTLFLYDYVISQGQFKTQGSINSRRGAAHFAHMTSTLKDESLVDFVRDSFAPAMACWPAIYGRFTDIEVGGRQVNINEKTKQLIQSIRELSEGPVVPAILLYMVNYVSGALPEGAFCEYLHTLESYVARWILGGRPLSPLRSRFMQILGDIDGRIDLGVLKNILKKDCISDAAIRKLAIKGMYPYYERIGGTRIGAILRGIERRMSGAGSHWFQLGNNEGQFTIEHIFPQSNATWEDDLHRWGKQPIGEMKHLLHSIGNLTVVTVEHNSAVGNSTFKDKKEYKLSDAPIPPMKLNNSWLSQRKWTAQEIMDRAELLISKALEYWRID
jgi:hypothetical protein